MATIVNTPPATQTNESSGAQFLLGAIVFLVALFLLFYYGLPALRSASTPVQQSGSSIEVPEQIDVNVNGGTGNTQPAPAQ